jgi:hypothetical protein
VTGPGLVLTDVGPGSLLRKILNFAAILEARNNFVTRIGWHRAIA